MANIEQVLTRILNALNEKTGNRGHACNLCGQNSWVLGNRFVRLSAQKDLINTNLGGEGFPFVLLICANCGNTHLINVMVLGFKDLSELTIEEDTNGTK